MYKVSGGSNKNKILKKLETPKMGQLVNFCFEVIEEIRRY